MESTVTPTGVAPAVPVYASWGSRVWASTLDGIFNFPLLSPVGILFALVRSDLANWVGLMLPLVYFTLGHGGATGQTWASGSPAFGSHTNPVRRSVTCGRSSGGRSRSA
jgi:hypothetical protein